MLLEELHDVGYANVKTFRDVFKKITGMTPMEYGNKYNGE
jgi:YesN/AraC family two-component response regulator